MSVRSCSPLLISLVAVASCKLGADTQPSVDAQAIIDAGIAADGGEVTDLGSDVDGGEVDSGVLPDSGGIDGGVLPDSGVVIDAGAPSQPTCTGSQACVLGETCAWEDVTHTRSICKYLRPGSGLYGEPCVTSDDCGQDAHAGVLNGCVQHPVYGGMCNYDDSFGAFCHECQDEAMCYFDYTPALEVVCGMRCTFTRDCPAELECVAFEGASPDPVRSHRFCQPQQCNCGTPDSFCFGVSCYLDVPNCQVGERTDCPDPSTQLCDNDNLCECIDAPCLQDCGTDADCPGESGLCVGGTCGHLDCSASSCSAGYACGVLRQTYEVEAAAQYCVPAGAGAIGDACSTPGDCAEGYCSLGQCVHRCATNADCGGDECGTSPAYPYDPPFCWSAPRCSNCSQPDQRCDEYRRCM